MQTWTSLQNLDNYTLSYLLVVFLVVPQEYYPVILGVDLFRSVLHIKFGHKIKA